MLVEPSVVHDSGAPQARRGVGMQSSHTHSGQDSSQFWNIDSSEEIEALEWEREVGAKHEKAFDS